MKRRKFIQLSASMGALPMIGPGYTSLAQPTQKKRESTVVLFQGDSITDAGRDRKSEIPDKQVGLGRGYAFLAATQLYERYPDLRPKVYNRGISGHKVYQLADRWERDTVDLKPDVLSILIGVNDHWHSLKDYPGTPEKYHKDFDALLARTKKELPDTRLIICEPFVLLDGTAIDS